MRAPCGKAKWPKERKDTVSPFTQMVYGAVRRIPAGKVATYGQIALMAGSPRASRIVGALMAAVPEREGLPCHRVVYRDGSLCPGDAFGSPDLQRQALEGEGVRFLPDGRVDLAPSGWDGK